MNYQHFTQEERYQIYALSKTKITQKEIAKIIGKHPSIISRKLK
ncbi:helix-turn-helix domain-containing protein [Neisseriaceae bacterium PsAf]|nr:helix-turn-helix domain-containing protein [Neisseriaceae bacterium PsAf]